MFEKWTSGLERRGKETHETPSDCVVQDQVRSMLDVKPLSRNIGRSEGSAAIHMIRSTTMNWISGFVCQTHHHGLRRPVFKAGNKEATMHEVLLHYGGHRARIDHQAAPNRKQPQRRLSRRHHSVGSNRNLRKTNHHVLLRPPTGHLLDQDHHESDSRHLHQRHKIRYATRPEPP